MTSQYYIHKQLSHFSVKTNISQLFVSVTLIAINILCSKLHMYTGYMYNMSPDMRNTACVYPKIRAACYFNEAMQLKLFVLNVYLF